MTAGVFGWGRTRRAADGLDAALPRPESGGATRCFGCLLLPGFSMFDLASVVDALRIANMTARRKLYRWRTISADGGPAVSSSGIALWPDTAIAADEDFHAVILCGGDAPKEKAGESLTDWLWRLDRAGVSLGAIGSGGYVLASAGLLEGRRCTCHWQDHSVLIDDFPRVHAQASLFEIDGARLTSAGGMGTLALMVTLIGESNGPDLALAVADKLLLPGVPQSCRPSLYPLWRSLTPSGRSDRLRDVLEVMSANVTRPLSNRALGARVNLSARQVERLIRRHLGTSPRRLAREFQLQHARWLLRHTTLPVAKVAVASGFHSASYFGRMYRGFFGHLPGQERFVRGGEKTSLLASYRQGHCA